MTNETMWMCQHLVRRRNRTLVFMIASECSVAIRHCTACPVTKSAQRVVVYEEVVVYAKSYMILDEQRKRDDDPGASIDGLPRVCVEWYGLSSFGGAGLSIPHKYMYRNRLLANWVNKQCLEARRPFKFGLSNGISIFFMIPSPFSSWYTYINILRCSPNLCVFNLHCQTVITTGPTLTEHFQLH